MPKKNQHVIPTKEGWALRATGSGKVTKRFETQKEAIRFGRRVARNQKSELVIHGADGRIREKRAYGPDPHPPKG